MKRIICLLLVLVTVFMLTACTVTIPIGATSNNVGSKTGTTTAEFLGPIPIGDNLTGDFSIDTAAKNGGIKKISHVDLQIEQILAYFAVSTIVHGE